MVWSARYFHNHLKCFLIPHRAFPFSAVLKLAYNKSSKLAAPVNPPNLNDSCPNHYVFGAVAAHGFVFGKKSERCVPSWEYAIDRRMCMMTATRHIMVMAT